MPARIEDYAMVGDCETAALIARDGSVDWLCWPRFDSNACFAALLGSSENGRWLLCPLGERPRVSRRYRPGTLILETRFETAEGAATIIDFMPVGREHSHLMRIVRGERGRLAMCFELVLRLDYGSIVPWVTRLEPRTLRAVAGPDMVLLRSAVDVRGEELKTVGEFTVAAGEIVPFTLTYALSHRPPPDLLDAATALEDTERYWREWCRRGRVTGPLSDIVHRSLITLKALTYAPTGGTVAAVTTSLPEQLGGERNWDYRFCWLRDATLTLLAFMHTGYYEEAEAWREWLLRAVAGSADQVQTLYGVAGERRCLEWIVPGLSGYEGAKPVRVGNAAHAQLQLDVYGEVVDALHHARIGGVGASRSGWDLQNELLAHLEEIWREPDESIWEVRSGRQQFTYSKIMAWVAFDRALKSAECFGLDGPLDRWRALCAEIHEDVCRNGFDAELGSFVQCYGTPNLDASLLLIPAIGFLPAQDPRVRGTIAAIERTLLVDGLVLRYDTGRTEDGLPAGEGAFLACSFWLVDAYTLTGQIEKAKQMFARLAALANDVGLLSEEYDPRERRLVGNFPQAFSHLALVNSAVCLGRLESPREPGAAEKASAAAAAGRNRA
jgi:GH15 family glucan-1,4-alpha-glucosidase